MFSARRSKGLIRYWCCALLLMVAAQGAAAANYRLNVVVELNPGGKDSFVAAWETLRDAAVEAGYPFYTVISESGNRLHFVSLIEDFEGLTTARDYHQRLSTDPALAAPLQTLRENALSYRSYLSEHDKVRSYAPEGSYSGPYHRLETFHFSADKRAGLEEAFAKLNAAWKQAGIPSAFHVMWHGLGASGGEVTMLTSGKTPLEHANKEATARDKATPGYEEFEAALWELVDHSSTRYWTSRVDLTLKPKGL